MWGRLGDNTSRTRDEGQRAACVALEEKGCDVSDEVLAIFKSSSLVKCLDRSCSRLAEKPVDTRIWHQAISWDKTFNRVLLVQSFRTNAIVAFFCHGQNQSRSI
jgi:hypothetical protein